MPRFTAEREESTFVDSTGVRVHTYAWRVGEPKAIVQLAHGLGEHALRYEAFAQVLVGAGYTVIADDHHGHGQTGLEQWGGDATKLGRLGPAGLRGAIQSLRDLTARIRKTEAQVPVVLMGHSWGSLMAQIIVNAHADEYDALVLTGTAYRMPGSMAAGPLNKRHAHLGTTGHEWLSRDETVWQAFADDPLCFVADVPKLFGLADGLRLYGGPRRMARDLPTYVAVGEDDSLGGARSAERLARAYRERGGLTDVTLRIWPDARHEILNETNRAEVMAELVLWLDAHVTRPDAG
jgi:alpha-beta hydrolase superfamily lysophospholipase